MRMGKILAFLAVCLSALPALGQPEPHLPTLSQDQVNRLNNGEILAEFNNDEQAIGDVLGVVDAPPDQVLAVIADFPGQKDWIDDLSTAEVVGEDGEYELQHGVTDTPWPMDDRDWTIRAWSGPMEVDGAPVLVSTWTYVPDSGNIENTEGYWLLVPWGDDGTKTLVRYYIILDLGGAMPDFLLDWGNENMLPTRIRGLRTKF